MFRTAILANFFRQKTFNKNALHPQGLPESLRVMSHGMKTFLKCMPDLFIGHIQGILIPNKRCYTEYSNKTQSCKYIRQ